MTGSVTVDTTRFNVACQVYRKELNRTPREVVGEQAGLLMTDLGNNLPPRDPEKTKATIEAGVNRKFALLSTSTVENRFEVGGGGKEGRGDVHWIGSTSHSLFGIAKEADMTQASPEDLQKLYYTLSDKRATQTVGYRGKQKILIQQKITTKESTRAKLIKIIQDRIGLLRASFCMGRSEVGAKGRIPAWVMKHVISGAAKGSYINELNQSGKAFFTIISDEAGASNEQTQFYLQGALDRRGESMMSRIQYLQRAAKKKARLE